MTEPKKPNEEGPETETVREPRDGARAAGVGCAWVMVAFNALAMGIVALSFASGPYSSTGQELWYRYGSLGFLVSAALLPALALPLTTHRSRITGALLAWMILAFYLFACYVVNSGGGV